MLSSIDLTELPGKSTAHKLEHYIATYACAPKEKHLISPLTAPAEAQRGETCKLKALADAIKHSANIDGCLRFPLYSDKKHICSLRKIAKKHGSAVGEVYSLEMLTQICFDAGFESEFYSASNSDDYIWQLQQRLDKNLAPIIFYDLDRSFERHGFPHIGSGNNEHAAVVVAYYKNTADEMRFIVSFWDNYYDFDGMELALSACHSLSDKRTVETFSKRSHPSTRPYWSLKDKALAQDEVELDGFATRTAPEMNDKKTPLKGKIMVVTKPRPVISCFKKHFFAHESNADQHSKPSTISVNSVV